MRRRPFHPARSPMRTAALDAHQQTPPDGQLPARRADERCHGCRTPKAAGTRGRRERRSGSAPAGRRTWRGAALHGFRSPVAIFTRGNAHRPCGPQWCRGAIWPTRSPRAPAPVLTCTRPPSPNPLPLANSRPAGPLSVATGAGRRRRPEPVDAVSAGVAPPRRGGGPGVRLRSTGSDRRWRSSPVASVLGPPGRQQACHPAMAGVSVPPTPIQKHSPAAKVTAGLACQCMRGPRERGSVERALSRAALANSHNESLDHLLPRSHSGRSG